MGELNSATQAYLSSSPSSPPAPPALPPTPLPPLLGAAVCDPHAAVLLPATPPSRGGRGARPRARCFDLFPPLSFASFPSSFISSVVSFLSVIQLRTVCLLFSPPPACLPSFALSLLSCSLPSNLPRGSALVQRPPLSTPTLHSTTLAQEQEKEKGNGGKMSSVLSPLWWLS